MYFYLSNVLLKRNMNSRHKCQVYGCNLCFLIYILLSNWVSAIALILSPPAFYIFYVLSDPVPDSSAYLHEYIVYSNVSLFLHLHPYLCDRLRKVIAHRSVLDI
jgi:hypothetical protein